MRAVHNRLEVTSVREQIKFTEAWFYPKAYYGMGSPQGSGEPKLLKAPTKRGPGGKVTFVRLIAMALDEGSRAMGMKFCRHTDKDGLEWFAWLRVDGQHPAGGDEVSRSATMEAIDD